MQPEEVDAQDRIQVAVGVAGVGHRAGNRLRLAATGVEVFGLDHEGVGRQKSRRERPSCRARPDAIGPQQVDRDISVCREGIGVSHGGCISRLVLRDGRNLGAIELDFDRILIDRGPAVHNDRLDFLSEAYPGKADSEDGLNASRRSNRLDIGRWRRADVVLVSRDVSRDVNVVYEDALVSQHVLHEPFDTGPASALVPDKTTRVIAGLRDVEDTRDVTRSFASLKDVRGNRRDIQWIGCEGELEAVIAVDAGPVPTGIKFEYREDLHGDIVVPLERVSQGGIGGGRDGFSGYQPVWPGPINREWDLIREVAGPCGQDKNRIVICSESARQSALLVIYRRGFRKITVGASSGRIQLVGAIGAAELRERASAAVGEVVCLVGLMRPNLESQVRGI